MCDVMVHMFLFVYNTKRNKYNSFKFKLKKENDHWLFRITSIIPISIQVLIPDLVFPVYKIDREESEKPFLRNV